MNNGKIVKPRKNSELFKAFTNVFQLAINHHSSKTFRYYYSLMQSLIHHDLPSVTAHTKCKNLLTTLLLNALQQRFCELKSYFCPSSSKSYFVLKVKQPNQPFEIKFWSFLTNLHHCAQQCFCELKSCFLLIYLRKRESVARDVGIFNQLGDTLPARNVFFRSRKWQICDAELSCLQKNTQ